LLKLEPLKTKTSDEFASDSYIKDIVERNLEVAAQACIDIANRIISMEQLAKPHDAYGAIDMLGKVGVLPRELAETNVHRGQGGLLILPCIGFSPTTHLQFSTPLSKTHLSAFSRTNRPEDHCQT